MPHTLPGLKLKKSVLNLKTTKTMKKISNERKVLPYNYAKKILLTMKLSFLLLILTVFQSFAVDLLSQKFVLISTGEATEISQILENIEKQSSVRFLYRSETIENKTAKLDTKTKHGLKSLNR
jgi:hypothetical protein